VINVNEKLHIYTYKKLLWDVVIAIQNRESRKGQLESGGPIARDTLILEQILDPRNTLIMGWREQ
jgi:hypothetical protein